MRPEGHLITSIAASVGVYAISRSVDMAAACFIGGFLIDSDHYFDYVVFNKQYSLNPFRFLNYYFDRQYSKVVLFLHSYELMTLLLFLGILTHNLFIAGYLLGAGMHLVLDIIYNGEGIKKPALFYSFLYRARNNFDAHSILYMPDNSLTPESTFPAADPKIPS